VDNSNKVEAARGECFEENGKVYWGEKEQCHNWEERNKNLSLGPGSEQISEQGVKY